MKLRLIMKLNGNNRSLLGILIILLLSIAFFKTNYFETLKYNVSAATLVNKNIHEVVSCQKNKDTFYLYIGRSSCPHCRIFLPKLTKVISENNIQESIFLLDSSDYKTNIDLIEFRKKYDVPTVPSLLQFNGENLTKRLDITDDTTNDEIKKFFYE